MSTIKHLENGIEIDDLTVTGSISGISYNDLDDKPTIPSINLNNNVTTNPLFFAPTSVGTNGYELISSGSGAPFWRAPCFGICSTSGALSAKAATIANFKLITGARIVVKFNNTHTGNNAPTLNVTTTGAKSIRWNDNTEVDKNTTWLNGETLELVYDGTYWVILRNPHTWEHNIYYNLSTSSTAYATVYFKMITSKKTVSFDDVLNYLENSDAPLLATGDGSMGDSTSVFRSIVQYLTIYYSGTTRYMQVCGIGHLSTSDFHFTKVQFTAENLLDYEIKSVLIS